MYTMASSSDDSMMNATLVSDLPPPMISSMADTKPSQQAAPSSYQDLVKNLDIKQMSGQNMQMPASIQMQQQMPQQQLPQQQLPQQTQQQMQQMQMKQMQMQMQTPDNAMDMLHARSSTYSGTMPQSAPIGEFSSGAGMDMAQGPIVNSLLPDPLFFNPLRKRGKCVANHLLHRSLWLPHRRHC